MKTVTYDETRFVLVPRERPVAWEHQCSGGIVVLSYRYNDERIENVHRVRPLAYSDTDTMLAAAPSEGEVNLPHKKAKSVPTKSPSIFDKCEDCGEFPCGCWMLPGECDG